jgi:methylsterol monooxygenase
MGDAIVEFPTEASWVGYHFHMGFTYQSPRPVQGLSTLALVALPIGVGATPWGQDVWAQLVNAVPDVWLMTLGIFVLHKMVFWPLAMVLHHVDVHDRPAFIARHRIQDGKRRHPPLKQALKVLAINQLFWSPIMLVLLTAFMKWRGWAASPQLPSLGTFVYEVLGLSVFSLVLFYSAHRMLHRKWWMKKVHRVHHEFRTSTALGSEYAHPFEYLVGNWGALALGVAILLPSLPSIAVFTVISVFTFVIHHGGYNLPWAPWSIHHDWHHYRYIEAFGTLGILDRILGTDQELAAMKDGDYRKN